MRDDVMQGDVRDMVDGMSEADARTLADFHKGLRNLIARVPGADQDESRLRAFTMIACTCTEMMGCPVQVAVYPKRDRVLQCQADGKVKRLDVEAGEAA